MAKWEQRGFIIKLLPPQTEGKDGKKYKKPSYSIEFGFKQFAPPARLNVPESIYQQARHQLDAQPDEPVAVTLAFDPTVRSSANGKYVNHNFEVRCVGGVLGHGTETGRKAA
ncbi:MAG: hypothetical protein K8T25_07145 [Planctomycetia bacterium]|nr:hypothetical protein [Planctomycetia bacterium]